MDRPNSAIRVSYNKLMDFFVLWLKFLKPLHNLSDRELEVAACMLKYRYTLSKIIQDNNILNNVLFSKENKDKMLKELNLTNQYYQVILGKLRRCKFLIDGKINNKFTPKFDDNKPFTLLLMFDKTKQKDTL